jgi:hypothetical protein
MSPIDRADWSEQDESMRRILLLFALIAAISGSGSTARATNTVSAAQAASTHTVSAAQPGSIACKDGYYKNVSGHCVRRPSNDPKGATAKCRDGSYSYSEHASGTCSHHGGVARWIHHP